MRELYSQRPNNKFLGLPFAPLVWIYYMGEKRYHVDKFEKKKEKYISKFDKKIAATDSGNVKRLNNLAFLYQS
ncbi:MAG: hypothetical protein HC859_05720, partial [Bacteroidia bacterium]|nr:hypothetical protein [Bacteroidia bacterium]